MPRVTSVLTVVACAAVLSNCSWSRLDDESAVAAPTTTVSDEMRSVPTVTVPGPVPSADAAGEVAAAVPGQDPGAPPTTALVGDPKPNVDSRATLPPLPESPVVDGCTRLAEVAAADAVTAGAGSPAVVDSIGDSACRFTAAGVAGDVVVEVHYVAETTVSSEWFRREGIEPVGELGGDAVGVTSFAPPGSGSGEGFTIAMINRREGAIVAVRGAAANRDLAVELALLVVATS